MSDERRRGRENSINRFHLVDFNRERKKKEKCSLGVERKIADKRSVIKVVAFASDTVAGWMEIARKRPEKSRRRKIW